MKDFRMHEDVDPVERAFREGFRMGEQRGSAVQSAWDWGSSSCNEPGEDEAWSEFRAAQIAAETSGG